MRTLLAGFVLLLSICCLEAAAQADTARMAEIVTTDGNTYRGEILRQDSSMVVLRTENIGTVQISRRDIEQIRIVESLQQPQQASPQSTRLLFVPNGFGLEPGQGYYQNAWILFNSVAFGFNEYFSIGGGMVPLFLFAGTSTPIWITAKASAPLGESVHAGAGFLYGTVVGEDDINGGLLFGLATFGTRDDHFNIGVGWSLLDNEIASSPTVSLGFTNRLSRKWYLMSENYYLPLEEPLFLTSLAGRYMFERASIDFGLVVPLGADIDNFIAVPWLGFTIPF